VDEVLAYPQPAVGPVVYFFARLEAAAEVRIEVYNVAGEAVTTLRARAAAGELRIPWDVRIAAPGVYLYRLVQERPDHATTVSAWKKLVLVKK
jgi:hypothetical protein